MDECREHARGSLEAKEVKVKSLAPKPCGENKWVSRYVARWNNSRLDLTLARVNNNLLSGYLWIEADDKTYMLKGKVLADDRYEMQALLPNGKIAAHLTGDLKKSANARLLLDRIGRKTQFQTGLAQQITCRLHGVCRLREQLRHPVPPPRVP
jgi:hypothetical protein